MSLFKQLEAGDFTGAYQKIKGWITGALPEPLATFVGKMLTDEGKAVESAVETFAQDVIDGGLSTASFVKAGLAAEAQLVSQNITFIRADIFAYLNIAVSKLQAAQAAPTT